MTLKDTLRKAVGHALKRDEQVYDDNETRDKYLRSLRRERRTQMEEIEKKALIRKIAAFKKQKTRQGLYGIGAKENLLKTPNPITGKIKRKGQKQKWYSK